VPNARTIEYALVSARHHGLAGDVKVSCQSEVVDEVFKISDGKLGEVRLDCE
jgi:hypothetical protein